MYWPINRSALVACATALAALAFGATAPAATIHTWVDEDGVRHFSDVAPDDNNDSERFDIKNVPAADPASDYYSIANQWARIRDERAAAAQRTLERERMRLTHSDRDEWADDDASGQTPRVRNFSAPYFWGTTGFPYRAVGGPGRRPYAGHRPHGGGDRAPTGRAPSREARVSAPRGMRTLPEPVFDPQRR